MMNNEVTEVAKADVVDTKQENEKAEVVPVVKEDSPEELARWNRVRVHLTSESCGTKSSQLYS